MNMTTNDSVIIFDHPNAVYNSGETLNGTVKLQNEVSKSIRGISIAIIGYGKIAWIDADRRNSKFTADEKYLNSVTYVAGSADGASFDLEPGTYSYTFTCQLPKELPTSIIEEQVKVKYKVIVTVNRHLRLDDVFKKDFRVNHILDLNLYQQIDREPRTSYSKMIIKPAIFSMCCKDNGDVKAILEVPTNGFIPGQLIPYKLIVCNNSNDTIYEANIKLQKYFILKSKEPFEKHAEAKKELLFKLFETIPRNTNKEFYDSLLVPNVPPSNATKFFRLGYRISVKICVAYVKKFYVQLPVIIGTIPFTNQPIVRDIPLSINSDDDTNNTSTKDMLLN